MIPRLILATCLISFSLFAQDKPTSLTVEEQEQLSRVVIRLQQAQIQVRDVEKEYTGLAQVLAAKHGATGCSLSIDKEWTNCPAVPKPAAATKKPEPPK
jgi:hypothetical protein